MPYTKNEHQSILSSEKEDLQVFLLYIGMAAILFNSAKPFEKKKKKM